MIGVGLIEEASKLIVPAAILLLVRRYRTAADGLLLGVAAGAGFAAMETMGYAFTTLVTSRGSITDTVAEPRGSAFSSALWSRRRRGCDQSEQVG